MRIEDIGVVAAEAYAVAEDQDEYHVLDGQPLMLYPGCGLGLLMNLKALMGERGPDPAGTILV